MIEGKCHCSAVGFEITQDPERLVECNCSICRRIGALWGHVAVPNVKVISDPEATLAYVHGDGEIAFHTCRNCGCTTHWESLAPDTEDAIMAVNFRMCSVDDIARFEIKKFDGADTWTFIE